MPSLYTIGHSNISPEQFITILKQYNITDLFDIRAVPRSRYVTWANSPQLSALLQENHIKYIHFMPLSGRRPLAINSPNTALPENGFRSFADYMQADEFIGALNKLEKFIKEKPRVVLMCAEASPSNCHRQFISDALLARKVEVLHILNSQKIIPHQMNDAAVIKKYQYGTSVYYPAMQRSFLID
jgi:uncharacterized protein (DUF488 family)